MADVLDNDVATVGTQPSDEIVFYWDRLGKLERFRRQIYALTVVPDRSRGIFYGLLTSYEFINDCLSSESEHGDKYIASS